MSMIGVRLHGPRDLRVEQLSDPRAPSKDEALVRLNAAGICGSDLHTYLDTKIGDTHLKSPLVLGHEFAGTVETVGDNAVTAQGSVLLATSPTSEGICRKPVELIILFRIAATVKPPPRDL